MVTMCTSKWLHVDSTCSSLSFAAAAHSALVRASRPPKSSVTVCWLKLSEDLLEPCASRLVPRAQSSKCALYLSPGGSALCVGKLCMFSAGTKEILSDAKVYGALKPVKGAIALHSGTNNEIGGIFLRLSSRLLMGCLRTCLTHLDTLFTFEGADVDLVFLVCE